MTARTASQATLSLTSRLVFGLTGLLVLGGLVLAIAAFAYGRTAAREAYDRLLVGAAHDIAASVTVVGGAPVVDLPVSAFELLGLAADDRIAYQVRGPGGVLLTGYTDLPLPPEGAADVVLYDAKFTGEPARFIRVIRRFAERQYSGSVEIIVGQTKRARTELAVGITRNALAGLGVGGIAMLAFAVFVVRRALRPLDRFAAGLAARDPLDLTAIDTAVPQEVHGMVTAINGFMGRLERQIDTMKRLISDTAHQLRTPVAGLRAQSDLGVTEADTDRRAEIIGRIHEATVRLSRLLDQLLSRALVIHRGDTSKREPVDLRDIALDVFETFDQNPQTTPPAIRLDIGDRPVMVLADSLSLTEAAKNLVGNALAHGTVPVTIGAGLAEGRARLWVEDCGAGPPPAVRAQLGERFTSGATGAGLGLSIAGAVAEAFGGRLYLGEGKAGFRATLDLIAEPAV